MIQSIVVYTGLTFLMIYLFSKSESYYSNGRIYVKSYIYFLFSILAFAVIFGMRYYVGIDYPGYKEIYETANYAIERYEFGFKWLTETCQYLKLHYATYFGIIAFIQALFFFYPFRREKYVLQFLALVILFNGTVILGWSNIIRQSIAMTILVYAVSILAFRQRIKYIIFYLLLLLAFSMHKSALIAIIFPLFALKKDGIFNNVKIQEILLVFFFLSQFIGLRDYFLQNLEFFASLLDYESYTQSYISYEQNVKLGIFGVLTFILYLILIKDSLEVKNFFSSRLFIIIYDFAIIGIFITYFLSGSMMLLRIANYWTIFIYPMIAYFMSYYFQNRKIRSCNIKFKLTVLFFILAFVRIIIGSETNTAQYVFFFQDDLRIEKEIQRDLMFRTVN